MGSEKQPAIGYALVQLHAKLQEATYALYEAGPPGRLPPDRRPDADDLFAALPCWKNSEEGE
eukprot:571934-Amphidinium_carterae.1